MARQATHRVETWELGLWVRKKSTYGARVFALPSLRCAPTPWPPPRSARFSFLRDDQNGTRLTPATSIKKRDLVRGPVPFRPPPFSMPPGWVARAARQLSPEKKPGRESCRRQKKHFTCVLEAINNRRRCPPLFCHGPRLKLHSFGHRNH
jgi:hypothetical protein